MVTAKQVDLFQGETEAVGVKNGGRPFGYVAGTDEKGGLFFTWMPTVEETVATLEVDQVGGDGELDEDEVAEFLRGYLPTTPRGRMMWGSDDE